MEYTVVKVGIGLSGQDSALEKLIDQVNKRIQEGWTPLGAIALDTRAGGVAGFYQTMTRGIKKP